MSTQTKFPFMNEPTPAAPTTPAPSLTLGDISAVISVIDICSKRGAFNGDELSVVGTLRGRFVAFFEANKPAEEPVAAPEAEQPKA